MPVPTAVAASSPAFVQAAQALPPLPALAAAAPATRAAAHAARTRIRSDAAMAHWRASAAHALLERFLARLAEAAVGHATQLDAGAGGSGATSNAGSSAETFDGIAWVLGLLAELARWTDEIAPLQSPQRFGNLAFRTWGARCEERLEALHAPLPAALQPYIPELASYLRGAFGSWVRLDYGSGHELALLAWLCTLARLGAFGRGALAEPPIDESATAEPQAWERALATQVVPAYLALVWGLQDRYGLEPAGSHGVWGLDDYHFIPYVIGAAQLRNQNSYLPSFIAAVSASSDRSPRALLQERASAPFANLLTSSVLRIHALKRGPFHEHSPILSDVSRTVPNFAKVAAGMLKMWRAECTGKRPVVQHFVFGGVGFVWDGPEPTDEEEGREGAERTAATARGAPAGTSLPPLNAQRPSTIAPLPAQRSAVPGTSWSVSRAAQSHHAASSAAGAPTMAATGAPWARGNGASSAAMSPTGAPWASSNGSSQARTSAPATAPRAHNTGFVPLPPDFDASAPAQNTSRPPATAPRAHNTGFQPLPPGCDPAQPNGSPAPASAPDTASSMPATAPRAHNTGFTPLPAGFDAMPPPNLSSGAARQPPLRRVEDGE